MPVVHPIQFHSVYQEALAREGSGADREDPKGVEEEEGEVTA